MKIPFHRPDIDEETIALVGDVLRSGWLTSGPKVAEFEKVFAESVNAKYAVFVNSGTAALHLAVDQLNLQASDEVIMSPMTFAATAEVVEYYDAKPVFVDIRPDTMNIDETKIEAAITKHTKAIMAVHYAGHPCEMKTIHEIAKQHQLKVIEDAAHCTPAKYHNQPIGSISDATCFSFYANKCITTGEGGMLTTNDENLAKQARSKRLHGLSNDADKRYSEGGSYRYEITTRGYKYNGTDISAAIGLGQLKRSQEFFAARKKLVQNYKNNFKKCQRILPLTELEHVESSHYIFPIRIIEASLQEKDLVIKQLKEHGIATSVHFIPLHTHAYYKQKYQYKDQDFPLALEAYEALITLPLFPGMTQEECDYVCNTLIELINMS